MRSKVKLSLIEDEKARKATFMKRKKGVMKKLDELVKLCDIKACGIIFSPYRSIPEAWPSKEGVEEVASKFKELSMMNQSKKQVDQESFTRQRLSKAKEKLQKLCKENRESQIEDFMFGCLKGEMTEYQFDEMDIRDLRIYMAKYHNRLTRRIEILTENGESSSSLPPPPPPLDVADADDVAVPTGFCDHIQYQNVNMDMINMNLNLGLNQNLDLNLDLNLTIGLKSDPNPSPVKKQSFMDLLRGHPKQMGDDGEHAYIPSMDGSHHQASTANLATTGHMSSISTSCVDACAHNITNDP